MMKVGRSLSALAQEIERQADQKRDFLADTRNVEMTANGDIALSIGDDLAVGINELAHNHIGSHTKIPAPYYDKMRQEAPDLLATNVNRWFQKYPATRMIRTLDGRARGMLSDRFRTLDNYDLLEAALPRLQKLGVEVLSCDVTETRMYLKVVDQRIKQDLPTGWSPTNKGHARFDTVSPALVLSNSEVGAGALSCQTSIYFGGCTNLTAIKEGSARKYHVGSRHELGDDVYRLLSDTTKRLTDAALWAQIGDVVQGAFSEAQFKATCLRLKSATEDKINADPVKVVEITAKKFGMTDNERGSVLRHLIEGGDLTKYGLHNAVTRTAEDLPSYDRASQFEQLGGVIVELPKHDWNEIIKQAA
jgi:hypothetical protein